MIEPARGKCPACRQWVGRGDPDHDSRTLDHLLESARIVVDWCYVGRPANDPLGIVHSETEEEDSDD